MKLIIATIQPGHLEAVNEALSRSGIKQERGNGRGQSDSCPSHGLFPWGKRTRRFWNGPAGHRTPAAFLASSNSSDLPGSMIAAAGCQRPQAPRGGSLYALAPNGCRAGFPFSLRWHTNPTRKRGCGSATFYNLAGGDGMRVAWSRSATWIRATSPSLRIRRYDNPKPFHPAGRDTHQRSLWPVGVKLSSMSSTNTPRTSPGSSYCHTRTAANRTSAVSQGAGPAHCGSQTPRFNWAAMAGT
jgi:hypothetical protein